LLSYGYIWIWKQKEKVFRKKTSKVAKKTTVGKPAQERWWAVYVGNEQDGLYHFADVKEKTASLAIANTPQGVKDEARRNRQKLYAFDRETKSVKAP